MATASTDILPPGRLQFELKRYIYYTVFEFDPAKSAANLSKHGIDFDEAQAIWNDDDRLETLSQIASSEQRWVVTGRVGDRIWTAAVTYRGETIRLISVRRARENETSDYHRRRV